jgi:hypothetical protein
LVLIIWVSPNPYREYLDLPIYIGNTKNTLITISTETGRPDKMTLFNVLIIIVTSVCVSLDVSYQELDGPFFLRMLLD